MKTNTVTSRRLGIMTLDIRGNEGDIGKEQADMLRHVQHPDLGPNYLSSLTPSLFPTFLLQ